MRIHLDTAWVLFFLSLVVSPSVLSAQALDPVGVGAMVDLEDLPRLRTHTLSRQVSSHDPTGGNDDGFYSVNFLYHDKAKKEYVLLEEQGPGCIYRIQVADLKSFFGPTVRIRIYLEGATTPQIDRELKDFFSGNHPPFLSPVVGASHKEVSPGYGYYCYVPIPFRSGVRVALTGLVHFYNISFHVYRDGIGTVPKYGQDRNISEATAQWQQVSKRPTPVRPSEKSQKTPLVLTSAASLPVLDVTGAGVVSVVEMTPPKSLGSRVLDLSQVRIKMFWDNETTPSVDAPLSLFFATGYRETPVTSLMVGTLPNQRMYCYFPMPFWKRARIVIENRTSNPVQTTATVTYRTSAPPPYDKKSTGYFRCLHQERDPVLPGSDYIALSTGGRGHVAGIVLDMAGKDFFNFENYLEGDDRIYIDYRKTPSFQGNGTEDFFNSAYYFLSKTLSLPVHGTPFRNVTPTENRRLAYRLFTGDVLTFHGHIRIGFQVGGYSHLRAHYRSAVYYYHQPEPALTLADRLDLGDGAQEAAHGFKTSGTRIGPITAAHEGDQDDVMITDHGVKLGVGQTLSFTMSIPSNNDGVVLRRRFDYFNNAVADQTAHIEVNSGTAGTWVNRGFYMNHLSAFPNLPPSRGQGTLDKWWQEDGFHIPATHTRGKTALSIKVTNTGAGAWNAYGFSLMAYLQVPAADTRAPGVPLNPTTRGQTHDSVILTWEEPQDNTGISHYEVWRSVSTVHSATRVGTALGPRFLDRHADPAATIYYYYVRAVDGAGNIGAFSLPVTGAPGRTLKYECEELLPAFRSPSDYAGQLDLVLFPYFGRPWSGDNQVLFVANSFGDWISFPIPVTIPGHYEVKVAFTSFIGTSSFEVLLDDIPLGPPVHHPLRIVRREVAFPRRFLFPGIHAVKIRLVAGPAIYSGTQVALDCITLTPR